MLKIAKQSRAAGRKNEIARDYVAVPLQFLVRHEAKVLLGKLRKQGADRRGRKGPQEARTVRSLGVH